VSERFDVRIEDRGYDAAQGVTVVRVSFKRPGVLERETVKGVAYTAPDDRHRQTKREGTYHAIRHACDYLASDYIDILDEAMLAAVRQGLFEAWGTPLPKEANPLPGQAPYMGPGNPFKTWAGNNTAVGPIGPFSFVTLG
jgi:hypothetical protein